VLIFHIIRNDIRDNCTFTLAHEFIIVSKKKVHKSLRVNIRLQNIGYTEHSKTLRCKQQKEAIY
jgi:hypothetical protein